MSIKPSKDGGQNGREFLPIPAHEVHDAICEYISNKYPQFSRGWIFKMTGAFVKGKNGHTMGFPAPLDRINYVLDESPDQSFDSNGLPAPVPAGYKPAPTVYAIKPGEEVTFVLQATELHLERREIAKFKLSEDGTCLYREQEHAPVNINVVVRPADFPEYKTPPLLGEFVEGGLIPNTDPKPRLIGTLVHNIETGEATLKKAEDEPKP